MTVQAQWSLILGSGHLHAPQILLLVVAGVIAGAVNAIAGGGSLISFPALLSVGYPAITANVTNTVALVPGYFGGTMAYRPELAGQRERVIWLGVMSLVGALTGALLLVLSPAGVFRAIVPWLILFSAGLLALQPLVARLVRGKEGTREPPRAALGVIQFVASIYGGYFGAGLGVMMLALLGIFLNDSLQRLNALKGLLSLTINLVSALFFAVFAPVAWLPVAIMALAALAGGNLGVYAARRLSSNLLRGIVVCFGLVVGIRLLM